MQTRAYDTRQADTAIKTKLSLSKEYGTPLPFIDHLGIERVENSEGRALLALEIKPVKSKDG